MRILYINSDPGIPILGNKGASVHVREFVSAAARQGHEVAVVCAALGEGNTPPPARLMELRADADDEALRRECVVQNMPENEMADRVVRRELRWLAHDRELVHRTRAALDAANFHPDFIYERHALFHCSGVSLARSLGIPRLLEVNAPLVEEQERYRGLRQKPLARAMEKASYAGADHVIAVSDEVAAGVISAGAPRERVMTVPNGVDLSRFRPGAGGRVCFGEGPVMGFIGSFKPWHGTDFLIKAFTAMARLDPKIRLVCIGEGPMLEATRADVCARGLADRVVLTGRIPHDSVPGHLAGMDLTVAPYMPQHDFYFSPLKVVESLAAGVPVIAARIGQLEKLVDDRVTGALFTPGDEQDFIGKAFAILTQPAARKAMGEAARQRALTDFGWDAAVSRIIAAASGSIRTRAAA